MNKKINTLLFILGATLFNIIVTVVFFAGLLLLYAKFLLPLIPESGRAWGFPLIFIAAIALSFLIYRFVLNLLMKKIKIEKYFDPVFGGRKR
ncbi:MAG: leader peptide processing enzyme [Treponema sp.]|nr:leader peptide processing enzyme [Treponema sp.]